MTAGVNKLSIDLGARATCCPEFVQPCITEKLKTGDRRWQRITSGAKKRRPRRSWKGGFDVGTGIMFPS